MPLQVASEGGQLSIFDFCVNPTLPIQSTAMGTDGDAIIALAFSPPASGPKWLAVTSGDAVILMSLGAGLIRGRLDCQHGKQCLQSLADSA